MARADSYLLVASIDFGTTFSGYAFSFKGKETDIKINKNLGDAQGFLSYKTPTSVLLNSKGDFEAFGFKAEQLYIEEEDDEEHGATLGRRQLFRNFKMMLHSKKKLTQTTTVCSVGNHLFPAIKIFTHAIRFLKDHLLEKFSSESLTTLTNDMIRWVITVPVIWSEESKQFMREAAFRAGCTSTKNSKQLVIALEPEAASFFCRHLDLAGFPNPDDISFASGTRYLVLDCGGGTNDMVVHEVVLDYKIKEICAINGGPYGGNAVNERFVDLLKDTLGAEFINIFKQDEPVQWLNFLTKFERFKKTVENDGKSKLKIEIPYSMFQKFDALQQGNTLIQAIRNARDKGVDFTSGSLVLSHKVVKDLFNETIQHIVDEVNEVFENDHIENIDYIFMVGGFSESKLLQHVIKETFEQKGCRVLLPHEAQLAILKGAVLYGHYQDQVISRIARKTYGFGCKKHFVEAFHDESKIFIDSDGDIMCDRIFQPLVEIGEEICIGSNAKHTLVLRQNQTLAMVSLYCLNRKAQKPVEYTDVPDLLQLGKITIATPVTENKIERELIIKFTFGNTEILVEATDVTTGNTAVTTMDFLSEKVPHDKKHSFSPYRCFDIYPFEINGVSKCCFQTSYLALLKVSEKL